MGLFGKDKSTIVNGAVKLVGNIRGMIDDSRFTDEERARLDMKMADATAQFAKDTLNESTGRSIARRALAVNTIYFFYILIIGLIVLWKFDNEWFLAVKELIIEFKLPIVFIMIMTFFFGGYYVGKFAKSEQQTEKK